MWYKRQKVHIIETKHTANRSARTLLPSVFSLYKVTYFKTNYKLQTNIWFPQIQRRNVSVLCCGRFIYTCWWWGTKRHVKKTVSQVVMCWSFKLRCMYMSCFCECESAFSCVHLKRHVLAHTPCICAELHPFC